MKKLLLSLSLAALLASTPTTGAWDKKDTALLVGAVTTLIGGELIRKACHHHKDIIEFAKNRPHVLIAGIAIIAIAARQYKDVVLNPILDWIQ